MGSRAGRPDWAERAAWFEVPRRPPPSLRAGRGCISPGSPPGRPRPEGHLHCRPQLRPGLRTWGPEEGNGGWHTRARSRRHVRAHAVSGCAAAADRIGGPTPPAPGHWLSGLGSLTLALQAPVHVRISKAFLCTGCSPASKAPLGTSQACSLGRARVQLWVL